MVRLFAWGCASALLFTSFLFAQAPLSGDLNEDGDFDAPDVVLEANIVASPESVTALDFLAADVDQSGSVNAADIHRVAEIVVGKAVPIPFGGRPEADGVSFWRPSPTASTEVDGDSLVPYAMASFWKQEPPVVVTSGDDITPYALASFWKQPATDEIEIDQTNVIALGSVSLWKQPETDVVVEDHDVSQLGTPSFQRD